MKNKITIPTLDQWLANQANQFDLAVIHFNSELQKAGFTCLSHAISQRGKSKEFFIEFFTQNRIVWDDDSFKKATLDEIKHELELALKFHDAHLKTRSKKNGCQSELEETPQVIEVDEIYIKSIEINSDSMEAPPGKTLPLKPTILRTVLKEGTLYVIQEPLKKAS